MRERGAVYLKVGSIEVTLGPAPLPPEKPQPVVEFVHDGEPDAPTRSRRNALLDHPSLRR